MDNIYGKTKGKYMTTIVVGGKNTGNFQHLIVVFATTMPT